MFQNFMTRAELGKRHKSSIQNAFNLSSKHGNQDDVLLPFLQSAVPLTPESLVVFKVTTLRTLAKLYGLKTSGTKAQLIEKLVKIGSTTSVVEKSVSTRKKKNISQTSIKKPIKQELQACQGYETFYSHEHFPFHTFSERDTHFSNCLCRGILPLRSQANIPCSSCHLLFHQECMKVKLEESKTSNFLCPRCQFDKMDPFYPLKKILWMTYLDPCLPQASPPTSEGFYTFSTSFHLDKLNTFRLYDQHIIVQCIRLGNTTACKYLQHEWPYSLTLKINDHMESIFPPRVDHKRRDNPLFLTPYFNSLHNSIEIVVTDMFTWKETSSSFALAFLICDMLPIFQLVRHIRELPDTCYETAFKRVLSLISPIKKDEDDVLCVEKVFKFKLTCPITLTRLVIPSRGKYCKHLQCFDLQSFLDITKKSKVFNSRWKCPECSLIVRPDTLVEDAFVSFILNETKHLQGNTVEISPDGTWKLLPLDTIDQHTCLTDSDDFFEGPLEPTNLSMEETSLLSNNMLGDTSLNPITVDDTDTEEEMAVNTFLKLDDTTTLKKPVQEETTQHCTNTNFLELYHPSFSVQRGKDFIDVSSTSTDNEEQIHLHSFQMSSKFNDSFHPLNHLFSKKKCNNHFTKKKESKQPYMNKKKSHNSRPHHSSQNDFNLFFEQQHVISPTFNEISEWIEYLQNFPLPSVKPFTSNVQVIDSSQISPTNTNKQSTFFNFVKKANYSSSSNSFFSDKHRPLQQVTHFCSLFICHDSNTYLKHDHLLIHLNTQPHASYVDFNLVINFRIHNASFIELRTTFSDRESIQFYDTNLNCVLLNPPVNASFRE